MIVRTDAVVLRSFDYGETSRIVTLLTRQNGIVGAMAKGARRPTSTFGSTLQPGSYVQAVYYYKPERGLQTLREVSHLQRFPRLTTDLERVTLALRALELTRALLDEGDVQPLALEALARTLTFLDAAEDRLGNALLWFQLHFANLLGFSPDLHRAELDALPDEGGVLLLETGAVRDAADGPRQIAASRAALRAFAVFARVDLQTAGRMTLDADVRSEVETLVDAYLAVHAGSNVPDRVRRIAGEIGAGREEV
ncbi:DNA repair protein RecO [Rubricoccus marinus]|uniref:DNA repair protein RecO n=1 Tax=Rubricoccus marinus TaxID=716817 RepID=A0A259U0Y8_9BACT|nr:DNA repair protein RecO [Rubricoccus marinus]OZC03685.1 DNA repair protein RecO [Rubricoccus marinus]